MKITRRNILKGIGIGAAASVLPAIAKPSAPKASISWEEVQKAGKLMDSYGRNVVAGVDEWEISKEFAQKFQTKFDASRSDYIATRTRG